MRKQNTKLNHFQENFQQSENNLDEVYQINAQDNKQKVNAELQKSHYQIQDEVPIQLLKIKPTGDIELNQQALELINYYNKPVGFVCLAGKYRTGKSFLLNKLLGLRGKGFRVDPATNACTQGIWMWSRPLYSTKQDCYIFFIDTEGSDATNRNSDHDAKVFVLAILISSYFIFNSVGAIDQMSISQLNLVTTLSKRIAISKQGSQDAFSYYMPKFLWLLRDFTLEMKDERGKKLTPNQYLQNCLSQQNRAIRMNQSVKNVRRALLQYFQDRQCLQLVRPVNQESDLKNLNNLPDSKIRKQFMQGVKMLKDKILNNATPKTIRGQKLNSLMFTELLYNFVQIINEDKIPNITSAWEQIRDRAGAEAYDEAIQQYKKLSLEYFASDEPKGEQIYGILKDIKDKTLKVFDNHLENSDPAYRSKLINVLLQKEKNILNVNNGLNQMRNKELIAQYSKKLKDNLDLNKYDAQSIKKLTQDYNDMINNYNENAKGQSKCEVLASFLQNFNPMLISSFAQQTTKKLSKLSQPQENLTEMKQQYQQIIRTLEQKNKSLQKQMESKANVVDTKKISKDVQKIKKLEIENEQIKREIEMRKKQASEKKECCLIF